MKRVALAVFLVVTLGCPAEPTTPPGPVDRDGIGTPLGDACAQLRMVGCPEGFPDRKARTCFEALTKAEKLAAVPAPCLVAAGTEEAVRACGTPSTLRVRCMHSEAQ